MRTNFRMPDVLSIGLGGGSSSATTAQRVGPHSVGYGLTEQALVFGGDDLTATDIAVAAGLADIGDAARSAISTRRCAPRPEAIATEIADVVERMRTSPDPLPVVAVGGGSILLPDELPGLGDTATARALRRGQRHRRGDRTGMR